MSDMPIAKNLVAPGILIHVLLGGASDLVVYELTWLHASWKYWCLLQ
jgi:hypothetical protein